MSRTDRYNTSGLVEGLYEPESCKRVLKNLLGIKRKREMDRLEAREQLRALEELSRSYSGEHRFTAKDICAIHKVWLGKIYVWAGEYRQVNVSKGGFPFAMAIHIPKLMKGFESGPLKDYTPCNHRTDAEVAAAIAVVHTELVLIHPFREGNGRTARLLSVLMALQAGLPPLDFTGMESRNRRRYFQAIQNGMDNDYEKMAEKFISVIRRTRKLYEKKS